MIFYAPIAKHRANPKKVCYFYLFKYMNIAPEYRELDRIFYEIKEAIRKFEWISIDGFKTQKKANCFIVQEAYLLSGENIPVPEDSYHLKIIFEKFKSLIDKLKKIDIVIYICPECKERKPETSKKKNIKCNCGAILNKKE